MQSYMDLLSRAQGVSNTPYTPYGGELVAGVNPQQSAGIANINSNWNFAQPWIQSAGAMATDAAHPITQADIENYVNPYTKDVVDATWNQFQDQNQQQLQGVKGNAISQGALGGNREAVAEAETVRQQNLAQAPVIANLKSQGYMQGVNTALTEQQAKQSGAYALSNLGVAGQNAALTGANAQVGAGTLQQGTQQQQDAAAYQQFVNQQAYPFQLAQWLSGITTGVGSQMGGTSTNTQPGPSVLGQIAGIGLGAAGILGGTGAFGASGLFGGGSGYGNSSGQWNPNVPGGIRYARGGGVANRDAGGGVAGMPYAGGATWIHDGSGGWVPTMNIARGRGAPSGGAPGGGAGGPAGGQPSQLEQQANQIGSLTRTLTAGMKGAPQNIAPGWASNTPDPGVAMPVPFSPSDAGGSSGAIYADGGVVGRHPSLDAMFPRSFATGGADDSVIDATDIVLPEEATGVGQRWSPTNPALVADEGVVPDGTMAYMPGPRSPTADLPPEITRPAQPRFAGVAPAPDGTGVAGSTGIDWSENGKLWPSLMTAGFGMMASKSPFAGVAIGEGGLAGMHSYQTAQNLEANRDLKARELGLHTRKLDQEADIAQKKMDLATRPYNELTMAQKEAIAHRKIEESKPVQIADPVTGMTRTAIRDPKGQWVYTDTGLPIIQPSSGGSPTSSVSPSDDPTRPFKAAVPSSGTMLSAQEQGLHGQAMIDSIPNPLRGTIEAVANYEAPITIFNKTGKQGGINQDRALSWVRQVNPEYDAVWYTLKAPALKNFYTATSGNSPVIQARTYNTAIGHAGELAEAIKELHTANPGVFQSAREAGIPFLSYLAANVQQRAARGTPEGEAWTRVGAILPLYGAETERFYAGSQGSETGRQAIQAPFNANLSFPEMMGALHQQKEMYKSKTAPLEQEFKDAFDAPGLAEYGTKKQAREWHVAKQNALNAEKVIDQIYQESNPKRGAQSGKLPPKERFNQLTASGMKKADAYKKMHEEGY